MFSSKFLKRSNTRKLLLDIIASHDVNKSAQSVPSYNTITMDRHGLRTNYRLCAYRLRNRFITLAHNAQVMEYGEDLHA